MDQDTGEIKTFATKAALDAEQASRIVEGKKPLIELDQHPDPKCKKCYGRGHVGKDLKTGKMIPCRCVKKANKSTRVQGKPLTSSWGKATPAAAKQSTLPLISAVAALSGK